MKRRIHSFEPFGTYDGPGIRLVVFFSGCPLRCSFCHNPEIAWHPTNKSFTPEEVVAEYRKNAPFYQRGGITFSGGEPLAQGEFLYACVKLAKEQGIHVTIDTSLSCGQKWMEKLIPLVDLWMVSVKAVSPELHCNLTQHDNTAIQKRITQLMAAKSNTIIRYVIIPGLTDTEDELRKLAGFVLGLPKTPSIELLRYHTMGVAKWEKLGLEYSLTGIPEATKDDLKAAEMVLHSAGITNFHH